MAESREIDEILTQQMPMSPMSPDQIRKHKAAVRCENCNCTFTHNNYKVRHHSHLTGEYLFAACNNCNLQLKPKKCKVAVDKNRRYFLHIVFHNFQNYDSHFVIKHFQRRYTEKVTQGQKVTYDDVEVISVNSERFLMFEIGNLKFIDSFQFLPTSLENLVSLLLKSDKQHFSHTMKYLGDTPYTFAKGVYLYSYMTDRSKFEETQLPSIDDFYNTLLDEPLPAKDYERAQQI